MKDLDDQSDSATRRALTEHAVKSSAIESGTARTGHALAVGTDGEASNARGIDGDRTDNSAPNSGAAYLY